MNLAGRTCGTFVVTLERRPDRRARIAADLAMHQWRTEYTNEWGGEHDGATLAKSGLPRGVGLFAWAIDSSNPWWSRPLKYGEIGCTLAHIDVWRRAREQRLDLCLVLEDDAVPPSNFDDRLAELIGLATDADPDWGLLYLGRFKLDEPDDRITDRLVRPAYTHCTFAYVLTARGVELALQHEPWESIIPVDELLPALYCVHPREDVRSRYPKVLRALAADPPLVTQRAKDDAGSDTEDSSFVW